MKVQVCEHCAGKEMDGIFSELKAVKEKLKEEAVNLEVEKTGCLGSCRGPVISVDGNIYNEVQADQIQKLIQENIDNHEKQ